MKDRDFLIFLHERLEHVHGEKPLMDYMHKLRAIIKETPQNRDTGVKCLNGMDDLKRHIMKEKCSCKFFVSQKCIVHRN